MSNALARHLLSFAVAAALAGGVVGRAGSPQSARAGDPVFVDFIVVSADGRPLKDLKPEEVSLRVDGRQRTISSLKFVELAASGPSAPGKPADSPPPPPYGTNEGGGASRSILLAIEDASIRPDTERLLRESITTLLGTLSSADRVGIVTVPQPTVRIDPTTDRAKVTDALTRVSGRRNPSASANDTCRTRDTLDMLRGLLNGMSGSTTPNTVIVFSGGLSSSTRTSSEVGSGACDLTTEHFQGVGRATGTARAQMFVVQAEASVTQRSDGLSTLAGVTGAGDVLNLATPGEGPLSRAARETSAYYLAAFEPDAKERDGQDHRVDLRITRAGTEARSRTLLTIPKADGRGAKAGSTSPRDMVKVPTAFPDLPVRVVAFPSRGEGEKINVVIMAEPVDPDVKLTAAAAALVDSAGKATIVSVDDKQLAVRPIKLALAVSPGTYRARFAAVDSTGTSGAADYQIEATLVSAGPLKLSGLVIGPLKDGTMLQAMECKGVASAVGYLELYGQIGGQQVAARMELAETVDGPAIKTIQPGGKTTSEVDKVILLAEIPIGDLKPGDYVVRAFVNVAGQPEGKVIKTLRKVQ